MYTIYSDGQLVHTPHSESSECGVFAPKLTVELNKAGSLTFTMPPSNFMYDSVNKLSSIITVKQDNDELFRGRVLNDEKDFYNQKTTYCEGELAFLIDSVQRPFQHKGTVGDLFKTYIANHNSRVEEAKRFTVGKITVSSANDSVTVISENYQTTMDAISENLLDVYGGYLITRGSGDVRYIDWLETSGDNSAQSIEFGRNLLDVTEYISAENLFTVLIPYGKRLADDKGNFTGYVDISSVNDGKDYLENDTAVSLFGRIEVSEAWSDIEEPSDLKAIGEAYLDQCIELAVTLSVKAVDLNLLDVNYKRIRLGDWVRVISKPHNLDTWFQCIQVTYDLINPENTEYIFGIEYTSLTGKQATNEKTVQSSAAKVNALSKSVQDMSGERSYIVNIPSTGWTETESYVYITIGVTGISSSDDPWADIYREGSVDKSYISELEKEFDKIYQIITGANSVTFYANSIPELNFKIKLSCK